MCEDVGVHVGGVRWEGVHALCEDVVVHVGGVRWVVKQMSCLGW